MPIKAKHFYMIRHGETEANAARIMAGSLDSPLNEKGRYQAETTRIIIDNLAIKPKAIIHSNLSRARDTANILNANLQAVTYEDPDLAEWHAGDWEGISYDDCPGLLEGWVNPPNGETHEEFLTRTKRGKNNALAREENPIMIVSHGGVFRCFGKFYNIDIIGVPNCTLYEFMPNPSKTEFPWDIWQYGWQDGLIREPSLVYSCDAAKIAL